MNKLVRNLFSTDKAVAVSSNPFNEVYECINQAVLHKNSHRLQAPSNSAREFYRFRKDMSSDLWAAIKHLALNLAQHEHDVANNHISLHPLPGTVQFDLSDGTSIYIANWNVEAMELQTSLSLEYNIAALRDCLDFTYQHNPSSRNEKWVWQCLRSLIRRHLTYAEQIVGIADFINGMILYHQSAEKQPIEGLIPIRDDLQALTIHQVESWIQGNAKFLKNIVKTDAVTTSVTALRAALKEELSTVFTSGCSQLNTSISKVCKGQRIVIDKIAKSEENLCRCIDAVERKTSTLLNRQRKSDADFKSGNPLEEQKLFLRKRPEYQRKELEAAIAYVKKNEIVLIHGVTEKKNSRDPERELTISQLCHRVWQENAQRYGWRDAAYYGKRKRGYKNIASFTQACLDHRHTLFTSHVKC